MQILKLNDKITEMKSSLNFRVQHEISIGRRINDHEDG